MSNYTDSLYESWAWEEDGSPIENWSTNGLTAQVTLRCLWTSRHTIMADIIDNQRPYPNLLGTGNAPLCWAATGTITPVARSDVDTAGEQSLKYEHALLQIKYETSESDDPAGSNLFTENLEPTSEFQTLSPRGFSWDSLGRIELTDDEAQGMLVQSFDYVQTRYRLPTIPPEVMTLTNKVNNGDVVATLLGFTFPQETLLYNPPTLTRQLNSKGEGLWTMTTRYSYRENGWNIFYHANIGDWVPIYAPDGSVHKTFEPADFSTVQI